jgi:hypothetical protein
VFFFFPLLLPPHIEFAFSRFCFRASSEYGSTLAPGEDEEEEVEREGGDEVRFISTLEPLSPGVVMGMSKRDGPSSSARTGEVRRNGRGDRKVRNT